MFIFNSRWHCKSCPILCNPRDYTVHGILQARILEWAAFPFSRGSSQPRDQTQVSFFTSWATKRIHLAMQETRELHIWSLGQEDTLEQGMATHSSIVAWKIPWTEEPGGLQSMELQRVGHDWARTHTSVYLPVQWLRTKKLNVTVLKITQFQIF